jgi:hypothetical protein
MMDIDNLPPPPSAKTFTSRDSSSFDISDLPPPPVKEPTGLEKQGRQLKEFGQGLALPFLGIAESVPYKPVQEYAAKQVKEIETQPEYVEPGGFGGGRTLGKFISTGALGLLPFPKLLKSTEALSVVPKIGARAAGGGAAAGVSTYLTEPVADASQITKEKIEAGEKAALLGAALTGTLSTAGVIGKETYNLLNRAFNGDVKRMSKGLKDLAENLSTAEAKRADEALSMAEKTAKKQKELSEREYRQLKGTQTKEEAGKFKPIPQADDAIGTDIKKYADNVYDSLKAKRDKNAKVLKQDAFAAAYQKELQGQKITDTQAYKNLLQEINTTVRNPVTGLYNESNQLSQLKNALNPRTEVEGVVIARPISFESLDNIRRLLRDRANGLPAEGFDAIGQIEAGRMANRIDTVMSEFSDKKIDRYLKQYALDSQAMRAFQTKMGKALIDEQLFGKGVNYAKVPAEKIPGKMFSNPDDYRNFIDATGGNKEFAEAMAKRYFSTELESIKGDAKAIEKFIEKNRTMLDLTGSKPMVEKYLADVRGAIRRGTAAETIATKERQNLEFYKEFEKQLTVAKTPDQIASASKKLAKQLLDSERISLNQYSQYINDVNIMLNRTADRKLALEQTKKLAQGLVGFGVLGIGAKVGIEQMGK